MRKKLDKAFKRRRKELAAQEAVEGPESERGVMIRRALTVRQPHVGRIVRGEKVLEIRSRRTKFRGRLALTASALPAYQGPTACVAGYASLVDCIPYEDTPEHFEASCGVPWRPGLWAWVMNDPLVETRFIPIKGRLGIWYMDEEQVAACQTKGQVDSDE